MHYAGNRIEGSNPSPSAIILTIALRTEFMGRRFTFFFWRALDHVMPDGRPVFLAWLILLLLIINGVVALQRW
jgi:hypothetical protein